MISSVKACLFQIVGLVLLSCLVGNVALAADCKVLHDSIRKESVLMKKKALVTAALSECPDDPAIFYQEGYILERLRKYKEALVSYKKAIVLDSGYAKAYFSIGDIEALQNNFAEAERAYRDGLRYEPGNKRALDSLASVQSQYKSNTAAPKPVKEPAASPVKVKAKVVVEKKKSEQVKPVKQIVKAAPKFALAPILRLNVPFAKGATELSREAQDVLSVVVGQAMNRPEMKIEKFEIGGHTDNSGNAGENKDISRMRAMKVQQFLADNFAIDTNRFKIVAHGGKKPKVENNSPANRAINNRVDFTKID